MQENSPYTPSTLNCQKLTWLKLLYSSTACTFLGISSKKNSIQHIIEHDFYDYTLISIIILYNILVMMQCDHEIALDTYFDGIFSESPRKLAVVGCGCSVATEPVAEISHRWNISQVYIYI